MERDGAAGTGVGFRAWWVGDLEGADAADDAEYGAAGAAAGDAGGEGLVVGGAGVSWRLGVMVGLRRGLGGVCRGHGGGILGAVEPRGRRRRFRGRGEDGKGRWRHGGLGCLLSLVCT